MRHAKEETMSRIIRQNDRSYERRFQVSGYVPKPIKVKLDAQAKKQGVSLSRLLSDALVRLAEHGR